MYIPSTYLVVAYFLTYLPIFMRPIPYRNWLPRWNQILTGPTGLILASWPTSMVAEWKKGKAEPCPGNREILQENLVKFLAFFHRVDCKPWECDCLLTRETADRSGASNPTPLHYGEGTVTVGLLRAVIDTLSCLLIWWNLSLFFKIPVAGHTLYKKEETKWQQPQETGRPLTDMVFCFLGGGLGGWVFWGRNFTISQQRN
jgi:hypothetical protein